MAVNRYTFADLVQFTEMAVKPKAGGRSYGGSYGPEWLGLKPGQGYSVQAVAKIVNEGWQDGADRLKAAVKALSPPVPVNIRRRPAWGEQGDEVCMDRVRAGRLDQAWRFTPRTAVGSGKRNVTVVVDSIAAAVIGADTMFWRGAAAVSLAETLTDAGYNVQMVSAFRGQCQDTVVCRVVVKPYTAPFDLLTAAACLAMPGFFRCLGHAWGYGHLVLNREIFGGGWYVDQLQDGDVADLADGSVLFIADQNICDAAQAQAWVDDCVTNLQSDEGNMGTE